MQRGLHFFFGFLLTSIVFPTVSIEKSIAKETPENPQKLSWEFQLEHVDVDALKNTAADILVLDYSFNGTDTKQISTKDIAQLKQSGKTVLAYLSATNAEIWRFYWDAAWEQAESFRPCTEHYWRRDDHELKTRPCENDTKPFWLGPKNLKTGKYFVKFWTREWFDLALNPYLERITKAGFDGIYVDTSGFLFWKNAAAQPHSEKFLQAARKDLLQKLKATGKEKSKKKYFLIGVKNTDGSLELL